MKRTKLRQVAIEITLTLHKLSSCINNAENVHLTASIQGYTETELLTPELTRGGLLHHLRRVGSAHL